jgi:hypothetical protein
MNDEGLVVYVDPGKKNILYMMNKYGEYFRYTIQERIKETGRVKYQKTIEKYKQKNGMKELEDKLTSFNSKDTNLTNFKEYTKKKNEINEKLIKEYKEPIFRKYKWYQYINTQRSEMKLVEKIRKKYGSNIVLIYGDWSVGKQMRNFISTPNKGIKRELSKWFPIYSIDEYKTSKVNYKTGQENENLYLEDSKGETRKMHSVLTYQMENGRMGCINRDKNSVNNMRIITEAYFGTRKRPEIYSREKRTTTTNPIKKDSKREKKSVSKMRTKNVKRSGVKLVDEPKEAVFNGVIKVNNLTPTVVTLGLKNVISMTKSK